MNLNKKIIIGVSILAVATVGYLYYSKEPKVTITINPDGSGTVTIGSKTAQFESGLGVVLSYRGYAISASAKGYLFSHYGSLIEQADISPNNAGSSRVQVKNNFDYSTNK